MLSASLSRTCFLFIFLSPDLSFFMEAKLGLAILGILIPRDLAALNCFSFLTRALLVLDKLKEPLLFSMFS